MRLISRTFLILLLIGLSACVAPLAPMTLPTQTVIPINTRAFEATNTLAPSQTVTVTPKLTATWKAKLTTTAGARATVFALTPSKTPRPTATIDPTQYLTWKLFESKQIGVSFEYPSYFDLPPYSNYGCAPSASDHSIEVGERIWISYEDFDQSRITLSDYLNEQIRLMKQDPDTSVGQATWGYIGNVRAVTLEYRFGGLNRYGVETYFAHDNRLYTIAFTAGGTCDMEAIYEGYNSIAEFTAYWRILETWRFLK